MEKHNDSTINRPEGNRPLDAALIEMDLSKFISELKSESAWEKNDRNAITIFKSDGLTLTLVAMQPGAETLPKSTGGYIIVQVVNGNVTVKTSEKICEMDKSKLIAIHPETDYDIIAEEESIVLLTVYQLQKQSLQSYL